MKYMIIGIVLILSLPTFLSVAIDDTGYVSGWNGTEITRGELNFDDSPYEYRSMWVEGYQIVNISEIKALVEHARRYNFNVLSPLINGDYRGVFYNSIYFNKHPDVRVEFDPLMELIKEAHKYGIQVHPWWHTLYGYPILRDHPEWRCQSSSGSYSWYWINPAIPEAREMVKDVLMEVVINYPIDGIKLDTIRYGGSSYSYDEYSIAKYLEEDGVDFNRWRRKQITETVELIYDSVMKVKPWFWLGADVFSSSWGRMTSVFQEPEAWAYNGKIDYITPMIYTTSVTSYNNSLRTDVNGIDCPVVGGTYIYIPGNTAHGSVPDEATGIQKMIDQVRTAQSIGAWGVCCFAYKFLRLYPSYGQALLDGPFKVKAMCPIKEQDIPSSQRTWEFERDQDREGWNLFDAGFFYPSGGVWSVSMELEPKFLSPRLNFTAEGINVIEISALIEEGENCTFEIYWGQMAAVMDPLRKVERTITGDGDWNIYSIHLDDNIRWLGVISYILIVPKFENRGNITIDLISLSWMPHCIRTCSYLGPFTVGGDEDLLDRDFIDDEGGTLPRLGDVVSGREWSDFTMDRDLLDFRFPLGRNTYTVVYSHVYVISDNQRSVLLKIGTSDGVKVWLNGEQVMSSYVSRSVSPDQNITHTVLNKGFNSLFIKMAVYTNEFSYFARFTDLENKTLDDLLFVNDIPSIGPPVINIENDTWFKEGDISIELTEPVSIVDIDHYEVIVDEVETLYHDYPMFLLDNLEDGSHVIKVTAVDLLGFRSGSAYARFFVDTIIPIIDGPFIENDHTTRTRIDWTWEVLNEPISGIDHFEVNIQYGSMEYPGGSVLGPFIVHTENFTLSSRISDGNSYIARITAVTGSGNMIVSGPSDPVLVDLFPPLPPSQFSSYLIDETNRTYKLLWNEVSDNIRGGLDRYELIIRYGSEEETTILITTNNSIIFIRQIGKTPLINIRAVDKAGNIGEVSADFFIENYKPIIKIDQDLIFRQGDILVISSNGTYDPDGEISGYIWKVDGNNVSRDKDLRMTLEEGRYLVELEVKDDLGSRSTMEFTMILDHDEMTSNLPIRSWLVTMSIKDDILPMKNITIPVYPEPEPEEVDILVTQRAGLTGITLTVLISIFLISILLYFGFMLKRNLIGSNRDFIIETDEGYKDNIPSGGSSNDEMPEWLVGGSTKMSFSPPPPTRSIGPAVMQKIDVRSAGPDINDPIFEIDEYEIEFDDVLDDVELLDEVEEWDEIEEFDDDISEDDDLLFFEEVDM